MPAKAVFFDIDGTLVDSNDSHVAAWDAAFRDAGLSIPRDAIRAQVGKGADMLLPTLLPKSGQVERDRIAKAHDDIFRSLYLFQVKPFPGARDLISYLHDAGSKVLLASSSNQSDVDHYVRLLEVKDLLFGTVAADEVKNSKPAPDIFARSLEKVTPLHSNDCIAVGDTPYDVLAAAKCQLDAVALLSGGFSERALRDAGAVAIYTSVADLLEELATSPLTCL